MIGGILGAGHVKQDQSQGHPVGNGGGDAHAVLSKAQIGAGAPEGLVALPVLLDDVLQGGAHVLEAGGQGDGGVLGIEGLLLVGVDADEVHALLIAGFHGAGAGIAAHAPDDVRARFDLGSADLLAQGGVGVVADPAPVDLDLRIDGLGALDVAYQEVASIQLQCLFRSRASMRLSW